MRKEAREVFVADDGTEFDSQAACEEHERVALIAAHLRAGITYWDEVGPEEVVRVLLKDYDITWRDQ